MKLKRSSEGESGGFWLTVDGRFQFMSVSRFIDNKRRDDWEVLVNSLSKTWSDDIRLLEEGGLVHTFFPTRREAVQVLGLLLEGVAAC